MSHRSKARVNQVWQACGLLPMALAMAALLVSSVVCRVALADGEETYVVDANSTPCMAGNMHFTTITAAVAAAAADPGVTINVCPGTYAEQIELDTAVTLRGVTVPSANSGNGAGAAIITVPSGGLSMNATLNTSFFTGLTHSIPVKAQVLVHASNVTLSDLAIDGTGSLPPRAGCSLVNPNATLLVAGVDFDSGSSGQTRHLAVRNQNQSNGSGGFCSNGLGILANQGAGQVIVRDSSISNFDLAGIDGEVPIQAENNAVTQAYGTIAFGIVLEESTTSPPPTVTSNHIVALLDIWCQVECPGVTILDNDLAITSTGVGIFVRGDGATINGNALSGASNFEIGIWGFGTEDNITDNAMSSLGGTRGVGIFSKDNSNDTVTGNTVNEAGFGIEGVMGNTVHGNTFYNVAQLTKP